MWHSFWCWVNRKSQEAIVRSARHELREHMANKPEGNDHGGVEWSRWYDRRDQLMRYLKQQVELASLIGADI